jgi:hypothetical protein
MHLRRRKRRRRMMRRRKIRFLENRVWWWWWWRRRKIFNVLSCQRGRKHCGHDSASMLHSHGVLQYVHAATLFWGRRRMGGCWREEGELEELRRIF